jgi:hypothetical protein
VFNKTADVIDKYIKPKGPKYNLLRNTREHFKGFRKNAMDSNRRISD